MPSSQVSSCLWSNCWEQQEIAKSMEGWWVGFLISVQDAGIEPLSTYVSLGLRKEQQPKSIEHAHYKGDWSSNGQSEKLRRGRDFISWLQRMSFLHLGVKTIFLKNIPI